APVLAGCGVVKFGLGFSQSAAPESPVETRKVKSCIMACLQRLLKNWFVAVPSADSQLPKLSLRMGATLFCTANWAAISKPRLAFVFAAMTKSMVAFLATAPAH